jgi:hypothetical protein
MCPGDVIGVAYVRSVGNRNDNNCPDGEPDISARETQFGLTMRLSDVR